LRSGHWGLLGVHLCFTPLAGRYAVSRREGENSGPNPLREAG
jgi:hypothetical protein